MLENEKNSNLESLVNEAFKTETQFSLSENFADVVAEKVSRKFAWSQYMREFFIYVGVVIGILVSLLAISLFWFEADWKEGIEFVTANLGAIIGINIILLFILFADRVILRYFMFKSKIEII